jgi:hypothetical protein
VIGTRVRRFTVNDQLAHFLNVVLVDDLRKCKNLCNFNRNSNLINFEIRVWRNDLNRSINCIQWLLKHTVRPLKSTRFPDKFPRKRPCFPLRRWANDRKNFLGCNSGGTPFSSLLM